MTNSTTSLPKLLSRKNRAWASFDFVADGHPHKIPADGTHTDWTPPAFRGPFREGNIIGLARGWGPGEPQGRYGAMQRVKDGTRFRKGSKLCLTPDIATWSRSPCSWDVASQGTPTDAASSPSPLNFC